MGGTKNVRLLWRLPPGKVYIFFASPPQISKALLLKNAIVMLRGVQPRLKTRSDSWLVGEFEARGVTLVRAGPWLLHRSSV